MKSTDKKKGAGGIKLIWMTATPKLVYNTRWNTEKEEPR